MKKIFVPFMSKDGGQASFGAAYPVAQQLDCEIEVCHMRDEPYVAYPYAIESAVVFSDKTLQKIEEMKKERARELKKSFEALYKECERANKSGRKVPAEWTEMVGRPDIEFGRAARCADLVITARPHSEEEDRDQSLLEQLLMASGTPMLVAPSSGDPVSQALIAWNGSLESSRAVRSAIPLLKHVQSVSVLTLGRLAVNAPGPDVVCRYLQTHGIESEYESLQKFDGSAERAMEDYAKSEGCNLIVMGAYSHSRLREMVLGGMTRHMLRDVHFSLFLSH